MYKKFSFIILNIKSINKQYYLFFYIHRNPSEFVMFSNLVLFKSVILEKNQVTINISILKISVFCIVF